VSINQQVPHFVIFGLSCHSTVPLFLFIFLFCKPFADCICLLCCLVVLQGENGWGNNDFEVEAILDQQLSEVQHVALCLWTCVFGPVELDIQNQECKTKFSSSESMYAGKG